MTVDLLASAAAGATAVALLLPSRGADRRLRRLTAYEPVRVTVRPDVGPTGAFGRKAAALLASVAVALLVGGAPGALAGVVIAVALLRGLARLEPAARRARREAIERDLPIALDLLGACLSAGTPMGDAVAAVSQSLGGPVGAELGRVLSALDLGVAPSEAWLALPEDGFGAVGRTVARAMTSGAAMADVAVALAEERRSALQAVASGAARRAGVAAVAPLGLCFLPAFVGTAVVPVVAGLAVRVLG